MNTNGRLALAVAIVAAIALFLAAVCIDGMKADNEHLRRAGGADEPEPIDGEFRDVTPAAEPEPEAVAAEAVAAAAPEQVA